MDISNFTIYDEDTFNETIGVDEMNFANKDLSNIDLGSFWISDCYFENNIIENYLSETNNEFISSATIVGNIFLNTTFRNIGFYRTPIEDNLFENCIFEDVLFNYAELYGNIFKNCIFKNCTFKNIFSLVPG